MEHQELAHELNSLGQLTCAEIERAATDEDSSTVRKIAAVIALAASNHDAHGPALDLMIELTDPVEDREILEPLETRIGQQFQEAIKLSNSELQAIVNAEHSTMSMPAIVVLACDRQGVPRSDATNRILKCLTQRDLGWWVNWIRQNRRAA